jgi:methenyltetrahydrofolate cyclohydrolase
VTMYDEKIGDFLGRLGDRVPAPGGSAAAAMHAAVGAALLGMVARYSVGAAYAEHQETIGRVTAEADELRDIALRLADADGAAFAAVASAYQLPKSTEAESSVRTEAIARALIDAAWPAAKLIGIAGMVVDLAGILADVGNRNILSDLGAAVEAARAAAATARMNVEISLAAITDAQASLEMIAETGKAEDIIARAEKVAEAAREQIRA